VFVEPHDSYIEIGKMVRTENVIFFGVKFFPVLDTPRQSNKWKKQPGPPSVEYSNQFELRRKIYGDEKKWKEQ